MHCLNDAYIRNSGPSGDRKPYTTELYREPIQSITDAQIAMNHELQKLPAPPNWILREDSMFSALIPPPAIATHAEEKEEDLNPTVIYREAAENLRAQAMSHDIQPVAGDTQDDTSGLSSTGATQRK